jgi:hypothetical protein
MRTDKPTKVASAPLITCPTCNARFIFYRSYVPHIDECGLESYRLECTACGVPLSGIIDPQDKKVLVSELKV